MFINTWLKFTFFHFRGGAFTELEAYPQDKGKSVSSVGYYENVNDASQWRLFVGRRDGFVVIYGSHIDKESPIMHKVHEGNGE